MLKQLTGRFKKDHLLIAGTVLLLIISYQLALKKTIEAWQLNSRLNKAVLQRNDLSYLPGYLERKQANLTEILKHYQIDSTTFRNVTLSKLAELAADTRSRIVELPSDQQESHTDRFIINKMVFEGSYTGLVSLLDKIEQSKDVGVLRSVRFNALRKNEEQSDGRLTMTVWLEIVK